MILGNFAREFIQYDPKNSYDLYKSFMRIRLRVDVRKPLKRGEKIRQANSVISQVQFKYEKLTVFCFFCGMLGHVDAACEKGFELEDDNGERGWSVDLHAERRRQGTARVVVGLAMKETTHTKQMLIFMGVSYGKKLKCP